MILLVDDEDNARYVLARILKKAGYAVLEAADGLAALSLIETRHCELVISDILMPTLNGYALVARIRAKWPTMPVILTSGYLSQDAAASVLNGSVQFAPKPIDSTALIEMVQHLMPR